MKLTSFWSSSAVHGPFFSPTLSQHGCLPIIPAPTHAHTQLIKVSGQQGPAMAVEMDSELARNLSISTDQGAAVAHLTCLYKAPGQGRAVEQRSSTRLPTCHAYIYMQ
jgi:hypothetical protein